MTDLAEAAKRVRRRVIEMVYRSQSSHVGAALSIVEVLVALYWEVLRVDPSRSADPLRDRLVLSKAHGSAALYAVLAERGFFPDSKLDSYYADGGLLPGHLDSESAPGVEFSAGSLGHGMPAALGMALAGKRGRGGRAFAVLGDGECNEGSVWEAAMLASHLKLDNLTAVIDCNKIQSFGRTADVIDQSRMADRWAAFGWDVHCVDGHSFPELLAALRAPQAGPRAVIADTVKGKGISYMEDKLEWHYKSPDEAQYRAALEELR